MQLRLVDDPETTPGPDAPKRRAGPRRSRSSSATPRSSGLTAGRTAGRTSGRSSGRRAARWGEWQLDSRTRSVGRAGVAAAREALERVAAEQERARAVRGDDDQRLAS